MDGCAWWQLICGTSVAAIEAGADRLRHHFRGACISLERIPLAADRHQLAENRPLPLAPHALPVVPKARRHGAYRGRHASCLLPLLAAFVTFHAVCYEFRKSSD